MERLGFAMPAGVTPPSPSYAVWTILYRAWREPTSSERHG